MRNQNKTVVALLSAAPEVVGTSDRCGVLCVAWSSFAFVRLANKARDNWEGFDKAWEVGDMLLRLID